MASARSTVSMARTTPAQKPRGEQSTILRSGLRSELADIGAVSGTESPPAGGRGTASFVKDLGPVWSHVKALFAWALRLLPLRAYIGRIPVIADDPRLRLPKRWAKRKGDLP